MRRVALLFFFASHLCFSQFSYSQQANPPQIAATAAPSVVFLKVEALNRGGGSMTSWPGSGFVVTWSGKVLTAYHVISKDGYDIISIKASVGIQKEQPDIVARVIATNSVWDLALLELEKQSGITWKPLLRGDLSHVRSDTPMLFLGYPKLGTGLRSYPGTVSNFKGDKGRWEVAAPINEGESGGPVLDVLGKVIAVINSGIPAAEAEFIKYVTPIDQAGDLLHPFEMEMLEPYEVIYAKANSLKESGRIKDYVDAMDALLQNHQAFEHLENSSRIDRQAELHLEIALVIALNKHVEGMENQEKAALMHLEDFIHLKGETPSALVLKGYFLAASKDPRESPDLPHQRVTQILGRINDLFQPNNTHSVEVRLQKHLFVGKAYLLLDLLQEGSKELSDGLLLIRQSFNDRHDLKDLFLFALGSAQLRQTGNIQDARQYWDRISSTPFLGSALVEIGRRHWSDGHWNQLAGNTHQANIEYDKAMTALSEAKRRGYRSRKLFSMLGTVYFSKMEFDNAAANFERAIAERSHWLDYYSKARSHFMQKSYHLAREAIETSLQLQPNHSEGHYWHGRILDMVNEPDAARSEYEKSLEQDERNTQAYFFLAQNLAQSEWPNDEAYISATERALKLCREALKKGDENDSKILGLMGIILNQLANLYADSGGNYVLAKQYVAEAKTYLVHAEHLVGTRFRLMVLDTKMWIDVRDTESNTTLPRDQKVLVYRWASNQLASAFSMQQPDDADIYYHMGYIAYLLGESQRAKQLMQQALSLEPSHKRAKESLR